MNYNLSEWVYSEVQHLLEELDKLKQRDDILAVYLLRSDETGQVAYYSYKQKSNRDMRTVKLLIITSKPLSVGYEDIDWYPLIVQVYYQIETYPRAGIDLATRKQLNESFRVFDKRWTQLKTSISDYMNDYFGGNAVAENSLLTDFPRFEWEYKKKFLHEDLSQFPLNDDLIYFAALIHMWCVDYFINVPEWVKSDRYFSKTKIGEAAMEDVHPAMLAHNVYVEYEVTERM